MCMPSSVSTCGVGVHDMHDIGVGGGLCCMLMAVLVLCSVGVSARVSCAPAMATLVLHNPSCDVVSLQRCSLFLVENALEMRPGSDLPQA